MPTELALLPIIESSYDPAATSSAAAAGLWQFIPSTGRIYGLKQTSLYDGRRDVVESTRAAYEFLGAYITSLVHGNWLWPLIMPVQAVSSRRLTVIRPQACLPITGP